MNLALGLIETKGLVSAIEAADAMVKAADVKIISKEKVTGALIIIKIMGETAAVKASVDAGIAAAQRVGELVSAHVIPRPDDQIDLIIYDSDNDNKEKKQGIIKRTTSAVIKKTEDKTTVKNDSILAPKIKKSEGFKNPSITKKNLNSTVKEEPTVIRSGKNIPPINELEILNVHALRRIARGFDNFPIKGRDISKANRAKLLDYFKSLQ